MNTNFASDNAIEYITVAHAIATLAYHDKNYLSANLQDNSKINEEIRALLTKALELMGNSK